MILLSEWSSKMTLFKSDAHKIFGKIESAKSRTLTLDHSYATLSGMTLRQDDIFRQSLRCVENELYRAAHVMAWAGITDCFLSLISSDSFQALRLARPNWDTSSIEKLSEGYTEYAIIDAMREIGIVGKAESKALHGMLSKRNECAHAGNYFPGYNETLGYISEIFSRLKNIIVKYPNLVLTQDNSGLT